MTKGLSGLKASQSSGQAKGGGQRKGKTPQGAGAGKMYYPSPDLGRPEQNRTY